MTGKRGRPARRQPVLAYGDTNLFVALLVGADHSLHDRALSVFRRVTATRIGSLLEADGLVLTERPTLLRALELYGASAKLDFADAYLAGAALEAGPPAVASFDSDFDAIEGVRRISA